MDDGRGLGVQEQDPSGRLQSAVQDDVVGPRCWPCCCRRRRRPLTAAVRSPFVAAAAAVDVQRVNGIHRGPQIRRHCISVAVAVTVVTVTVFGVISAIRVTVFIAMKVVPAAATVIDIVSHAKVTILSLLPSSSSSSPATPNGHHSSHRRARSTNQRRGSAPTAAVASTSSDLASTLLLLCSLCIPLLFAFLVSVFLLLRLPMPVKQPATATTAATAAAVASTAHFRNSRRRAWPIQHIGQRPSVEVLADDAQGPVPHPKPFGHEPTTIPLRHAMALLGAQKLGDPHDQNQVRVPQPAHQVGFAAKPLHVVLVVQVHKLVRLDEFHGYGSRAKPRFEYHPHGPFPHHPLQRQLLERNHDVLQHELFRDVLQKRFSVERVTTIPTASAAVATRAAIFLVVVCSPAQHTPAPPPETPAGVVVAAAAAAIAVPVVCVRCSAGAAEQTLAKARVHVLLAVLQLFLVPLLRLVQVPLEVQAVGG
mmetsp:Transcript_12005/g.24297  ORF Transcript_12005/g.24297 Transcript_12005/m.24297 type:complete len:479 (-) Transcript_12005:360-1796(-)